MSDEPRDGRLRFVQSLQLSTSGLSPEDLLRRLNETVVAVVVGTSAAASLSTQVTALTAVNLLARLFRRLIIVAPRDVDADQRLPFVQGGLGPALTTFVGRVNANTQAQLLDALPAGVVALHVADPSEYNGADRVYCAGAGWLAYVGQHPISLPRPLGENPVGPLVAAALGVAEVFKLVFGDALLRVVPADGVLFSALTYEVGATDAGPPLREVRLPETALIGAGSIGSAFLWGLAQLRQAQGQLRILDPDKLAPHNPDRAILVLDDAARRAQLKAHWGCETVQPWIPGLVLEPFPGTIREYIDTLPPDYVLPLAIAAVDSIESRRDIQDALPGHILNASTGPTKVEVSGHGALGAGPCLYCLYLPEVLERAPIHIAMARTGFGQRDLAELMMPESNRLLTAGNIRGIEQHNKLPSGTFRRYEGRRLPELLENQRWYSQAPIQLENGNALVTTAFVSALAGFFLLAEVLKEIDPTLESYRLRGVYEQELLGVPNEFRYPGKRDSTGYCLCHSPLRRRLYREKYKS